MPIGPEIDEDVTPAEAQIIKRALTEHEIEGEFRALTRYFSKHGFPITVDMKDFRMENDQRNQLGEFTLLWMILVELREIKEGLA